MIRINFFLIFFLFLFLPNQVFAQSLPSCSSEGFTITIDPSSPQEGEIFKAYVTSGKINTGDQFTFKVIEVGKDGYYTPRTKATAEADGTVVIPNLKLSDKGNYYFKWFGDKVTPQSCQSDPFTVLAAENEGTVGKVSGLEGLKSIINSNRLTQKYGTLGGLVSALFSIVFLIAGFLMFIWAAWGIFQYITAGGNKENLAKARARITWAIVGFLLLAISFAVSQFIQQLANPESKTIPKITVPQ